MPENPRIMGRRDAGVNGSRSIRALFVAFVTILAFGCGGERPADRLYREASRLVDEGKTAEAVERLETILRDYPDSEAANTARREITLYRGIANAVENYPVRRARDLVVQTARAVERFRADRRSVPESLEALVPRYLAESPVDPWGRALVYAATGNSYRLSCLGADGVPGGQGESLDLVVRNGAFVSDAP